MKALKTILSLSITTAFILSLAGCTNGTNTSTSENNSIGSSTNVSEVTSSDNGNSTTVSSNVSSDQTSSETEVVLVKDGKFILPNNKLSFTLQEDYTLTSDTIVYQFGCESSNNKFNLTVSTASQNIEEVNQEQMTKTYETTMQDFKLVTFEHIKVKEKSAIKMQLTGKLYGIEGETMLTQYMIQSGTDAYCFTFTQTDYYNDFANIIEATMDSLEIQ